MTDHLSFDQLCDLQDGALDLRDASAARDHMRSCAACAEQFAELSALGSAAAALPRVIDPPADLWGDIRAELAPRQPRRFAREYHWSRSNLVAAAAVIAVVSSALTAVAIRRVDPRPDTVVAAAAAAPEPATAVAVALPARLAMTEVGYTKSVEALQRTLAERRSSLAPSTVATVERSLRIADSAIAEARTALAQDPGNKALVKLFASNYERKIDLLRRATELSPRT
ncbi:MAG: hypothetical protein V4550_14690 [Gemmatimonadota bacterium]